MSIMASGMSDHERTIEQHPLMPPSRKKNAS